jgi:hypothetical protein
MTTAERHAIRVALATADFGRSPGLRQRMLHSLTTPPEWRLVACFTAGITIWALVIWSLL